MANSNRIIDLLHEAKALPAGGEREIFLAGACGDDAAMKGQIVSLLEASDDAGASDFLKIFPSFRPEELPAEKLGDRIGRYKLLEQIGEGGCGVVYMAEQEEPVRRYVALKVIKLGMDTKQVIARFEAERQALAMMDHPNIAKVLDGGATEAGRPYFVMELVRGVRITEYCDGNNLPTNERLELFMQVCQAVQHAHQKGIIHRDIKPSNIVVTQHDHAAVPKVIDFGIAKATTGQLTDKTVFTAFAQFIGTPAYMSPEQAQLGGLDVDTRTDIYSLGVLLYELLTGHTPIDAKEFLAAGMDEMRRKIREDEPVKPSTCLSTLTRLDLTTVAQRRHIEAPKLIHLVRGDLDWLVMKCLEKDRLRRYETVNALAIDIQRYLDNEPVVACPPTWRYRFQKLIRRNRLVVAAAGAVAVALILGLGISTWMFIKERHARERAVVAELDQERLRQEAEAASAESWRVATYLRTLAQRLHLERNLTTSESAYRESLALLKRLSEGESREVDRSLAGLSKVLRDQNKLAESEAMMREELAVEKKLSGEEHPFVANSLQYLAEVLLLSGKLSEAEATFREAVGTRRKLLGNQHPAVTISLWWLAKTLSDSGKTIEAEEKYREVLAMRRKQVGNEHLEVADLLSSLGKVLSDQARHAAAEAVGREALDLRRKLLGNEHGDVTGSLVAVVEEMKCQGKLTEAETLLREELLHLRTPANNVQIPVRSGLGLVLHHLADMLLERGALQEARVLAEEAVTLYNGHPNWPAGERRHASQVLANTLIHVGDFAGLEALDRKMISELRARPNPNDSQLAAALADSAHHLFVQKKYVEAEAMHREVLSMRRQLFGNDHQEVANSLISLALILRERRNYAEAETLYRQELTMRRNLGLPCSVYGLTTVLRSQGNLAGAEGLLREELVRVRMPTSTVPPQTNPELGLTLYQLAAVLRERKNPKEARTLAEEAVTLYERHPDWPPTLRDRAIKVLADVLKDLGDRSGLEALHRMKVDYLRSQPAGHDTHLAAALVSLTQILLAHKKFIEAETPARECLSIREKLLPDDWQTFNARSHLGASLLGQKKYVEAAPLLVSGYQGMKERTDQIPDGSRGNMKKSIQRLVQLGEATGQTEKAAEWKQHLADFDEAEAERKTAAQDP